MSIEKAIPIIFDFDYPVYNQETKSRIEKKIIMHYFMREICAESYGMWKFWLNEKMNMIMPYYNELYKSAAIEFEPLSDSNYTITKSYDEKVTGSSNSNTINKNSDTPQGGLNGLRNDTYLSSASIGEDEGESNSQRNGMDSQTISGKVGHQSYASMLKEYRETLLNIDGMIINELEELFFQLW